MDEDRGEVMAALTPGNSQQISAPEPPGAGSRVRVLFVDTTRFFGPLMQVHGRAMRYLDPQRYDVWLLADPRSGSTRNLRDLPHLGIWLQPLARAEDEEGAGGGRLPNLVNNARILAHLPHSAWKAWKLRVAVLHVGMTVRMMAVGLFLSVASGARLVVHVHESPRLNSTLKRRLFQVAMTRASAVIAVSGFIKGRLAAAGVPPEKIRVILNTVDLDRFHPEVSGQRIRAEYGLARDDVLVVCLGRFFPGKGQLDLARAMDMVHAEAPNVRALLIGWDERARTPGGSSFSEEVRRYCREHGLSGTVIIDAARPDAPEIMAAATIVAAPCTDDPFNLTVLEGMASGKPVVGYRSGGIPEVVGTSEGGILVDPGDVAGLARAILHLARDPAGCRERGRRARRRAERQFYESRLAEEVMQVYQQVTGGVPDTPPAQEAPASDRPAN